MTKKTLEQFLARMAILNPSWRLLTRQHLDAYYEVLKDIPDLAFDKTAALLMKQDLYGWPSAGRLYQSCMQFCDSDGKRLFDKTVSFLRSNPDNASRHDEWNKAHSIFKKILGEGWELAILTMSDRMLEVIKNQFCVIYEGGL